MTSVLPSEGIEWSRVKALLKSCATIESRFRQRVDSREAFFQWLTPSASKESMSDLQKLPAHAFIALDLAFMATGLMASDVRTRAKWTALVGDVKAKPVPEWLITLLENWCTASASLNELRSYPFEPANTDAAISWLFRGNYEAIAWLMSLATDLADRVRDDARHEALFGKILGKALEVLEKLTEFSPFYFSLPLSVKLKSDPWQEPVYQAMWETKPDAPPKSGNMLHTVGVQSVCTVLRIIDSVLADDEKQSVDDEKRREIQIRLRNVKEVYSRPLLTASLGADNWKLDPSPLLLADAVQLATVLWSAPALLEHVEDGDSRKGSSRAEDQFPKWSQKAILIASELQKMETGKLLVPAELQFRVMRGASARAEITYARDYTTPLFAKLEAEIALDLWTKNQDEGWSHALRATEILERLLKDLNDETGIIKGPLASTRDAEFAVASAIAFTGAVQDALVYLLYVLIKSGKVKEEGGGPEDPVLAFSKSFYSLVHSTVRKVLTEEPDTSTRPRGSTDDFTGSREESDSLAPRRLATELLNPSVVDTQVLHFLACLYLAYHNEPLGEKDGRPEPPVLSVLEYSSYAQKLVTCVAWNGELGHPAVLQCFVEKWHGRTSNGALLKNVDPKRLWCEKKFCLQDTEGKEKSTRLLTPRFSEVQQELKVLYPADLDDWQRFLRWIRHSCPPPTKEAQR